MRFRPRVRGRTGPPFRSGRDGSIWRLPPSPQRTVALTFDDGPQPNSTEAVLDSLVAEGVTATFFVVGQQCERHAELLQRVVDAGMGVGIHGWSHADLVGRDTRFVEQELRRSIEIVRSAGARPTLFRPPYGHWDRRVIATARSCGLNTITWDVPGNDWEQPGADAIADGILSAVTDRSIILLHDGGGDRRQTVAALPRIIGGLRAKELTLVNLSQQRW